MSIADILIWKNSGGEFLARWTHFLAGVTWIGLLYYFNFVQGPYFNKDATPEARSDATQKLVPRALWWFRWGAMFTFLSGLAMLGLMTAKDGRLHTGFFDVSEGNFILTGAILGTLMFLNVWLVIWPKQKIVIANAQAVAAGQEANPQAAPAARRAFLASRTNTLFSIPMLFFMAAAAHLGIGQVGPFLVKTDNRGLYWVVFAVLAVLVELNALVATTGTTTKALETHRDTIITGFVMAGVLYLLVQFLLVP